MKAMLFSEYGSPDVLQLKEIEKPVPGDDQVLIQVRATSLNDWDWEVLRGTPLINRLMFGLFKPKMQILGIDVAGRVEAVGARVKLLRPGDAVYGDLSSCGWGGLAEYVCAPETALAHKPAGMTFAQAAAIPQAGMLAVQGLIDIGKIRYGQKLLINGAGGGVGTFALQIARQVGAEVTAVDSAGKLDMLRALGAAHVIDYKQADFTRTGQTYDLILDVKTTRSAFDYARALRPNGTYVTVGGTILRLIWTLFLGIWTSNVRKKHMRIVALKANKDLAYMNAQFEAGKITPVIDVCYRLSEAAEAFRYFGAGRHKGKVIVTDEGGGDGV